MLSELTKNTVGGLDPWYNRGGPAKVGAHKSFTFPESSLAVEIKNTHLILQSHGKICNIIFYGMDVSTLR